ncbi:MAG: GNAT family N-acetyltransferase [Roseinatronobacter sp.]
MSDTDKLAPHNPDWIDVVHWGLGIGQLTVRLAQSSADMTAVQSLRNIRFRGAPGIRDLDAFDPLCLHLLVRKSPEERVLATARLRVVSGVAEVTSSYSAQFYDLVDLARSDRRCMEIGRICIDGDHVHDPDVLRALLAGLTRLAQEARAEILMGCASFRGADPQRHADALAYLAAHHIGPTELRPGRGSGQVMDLPRLSADSSMTGLRKVPALLRLYLGLGGWVSDHAVIDTDLDTLHVFAAVEVAAIPPARQRALQLLARG